MLFRKVICFQIVMFLLSYFLNSAESRANDNIGLHFKSDKNNHLESTEKFEQVAYDEVFDHSAECNGSLSSKLVNCILSKPAYVIAGIVVIIAGVGLYQNYSWNQKLEEAYHDDLALFDDLQVTEQNGRTKLENMDNDELIETYAGYYPSMSPGKCIYKSVLCFQVGCYQKFPKTTNLLQKELLKNRRSYVQELIDKRDRDWEELGPDLSFAAYTLSDQKYEGPKCVYTIKDQGSLDLMKSLPGSIYRPERKLSKFYEQGR